MAVANVTVKYVNPPRPGKKKGSIKTDADEYIGVWPDKLHLFEPGNSYRIIYTENEYGKTFTSFAGEDSQAPQRPVAKPNGFTRPGATSADIAATGCVQQWLRGAGQAGKNFPDANTLEWMFRSVLDGWNKAHIPLVSYDEAPPLDDEIPF